MSKTITSKRLREMYEGKIISVGYCNLQRMLSVMSPVYYNASGMYGWNYDVYIIDDVAVVTGYRPFGNHKADYDMCKRYEAQAEEIRKQYDSYMEIKDKLYALACCFVDEALTM